MDIANQGEERDEDADAAGGEPAGCDVARSSWCESRVALNDPPHLAPGVHGQCVVRLGIRPRKTARVFFSFAHKQLQVLVDAVHKRLRLESYQEVLFKLDGDGTRLWNCFTHFHHECER